MCSDDCSDQSFLAYTEYTRALTYNMYKKK